MHWLATTRTALALAATGGVLLAAESGDEKARRVDALFERNPKGAASGFGVWYDRAWNVRFVRNDG